MKQHAPAAIRNAQPILQVLRRVLPASGLVLEIASGTGQHALHFCRELPEIRWQPSDREPAALASIDAWRAEVELENLLPATRVDVCEERWPLSSADAMFCANMIHISPWESCLGLLAGASRILPAGAPLILYGPFIVEGIETAPSNLSFDASLRARDPSWGIRELAEVREEAAKRGLHFEECVPMPANNLCVIFRRQP